MATTSPPRRAQLSVGIAVPAFSELLPTVRKGRLELPRPGSPTRVNAPGETPAAAEPRRSPSPQRYAGVLVAGTTPRQPARRAPLAARSPPSPSPPSPSGLPPPPSPPSSPAARGRRSPSPARTPLYGAAPPLPSQVAPTPLMAYPYRPELESAFARASVRSGRFAVSRVKDQLVITPKGAPLPPSYLKQIVASLNAMVRAQWLFGEPRREGRRPLLIYFGENPREIEEALRGAAAPLDGVAVSAAGGLAADPVVTFSAETASVFLGRRGTTYPVELYRGTFEAEVPPLRIYTEAGPEPGRGGREVPVPNEAARFLGSLRNVGYVAIAGHPAPGAAGAYDAIRIKAQLLEL